MLSRPAYWLYERRLLREVLGHDMPRHLGLIQDGHRRFAREGGISNLTGYRTGAAKVEDVLGWCVDLGIPMVTLWWLSTENLDRDPDEVAAVLDVIEEKMQAWIRAGLARDLGIRIRLIGKPELLRPSALEAIRGAESATRDHDRLLLNVGVAYGGRQEIVDAVKNYLRDSFQRARPGDEILAGLTPEALNGHLYTRDCPDPDLIIRTSGEIRLSGFMLWQSAYSEFYFCDAYWPAFRRIDFLRAIRSYQHRRRRFGR